MAVPFSVPRLCLKAFLSSICKKCGVCLTQLHFTAICCVWWGKAEGQGMHLWCGRLSLPRCCSELSKFLLSNSISAAAIYHATYQIQWQ